MANEARKKLADLYRREKVCTIKGEDGTTVEILIKKMSPVDYERAHRKANAKRAMILASQGEESEYRDSVMNEVLDMELEELITHLTNVKAAKEMLAIEAEIAGGDKWNKEGYLEGLMDAWETLHERYAEDPEDPEALAVFEKLREYRDEVNQAIVDFSDDARKTYEHFSEESLQEECVKDMLKLNADLAWMNEFRRWEIYLSCFDPKSREKVFENRGEVDDFASEALNQLSDFIEEIVVEMNQGKGLSLEESSSD